MLPSLAPATRNRIASPLSAWPSRFSRIRSSAVMRSSLIWPDVVHAGGPRGTARPGHVAVAAALGISGLPRRDRLRVTLLFTAFETAMPVIGFLGGAAVGQAAGDAA